MLAAAYGRHGKASNVMRVREIPKPPTPPSSSGLLLVKVSAASLNPADYKSAEGEQMLLLGFDWPRVYGFDFSGTVVTSGDDRFAEGDEVFGMISGLPQFNKGTCAEYVSVDADVCVLKPNNVSHREAAAVPLVSITAVKMLRACNPAPGARMLVLGGAGGVGSHAIQLAKKIFKAGTVVATASAAKAEAVKSFGADEIVDYRSSKFEEVLEAGSFDVVLDCTGEAWRAVDLLKEGGGMCSIQAGPTVDAVTTWLDESQMDTKRILTGR